MLAGSVSSAPAAAEQPAPRNTTPGLEAAKTLSLITGVAISPLLGVGAVGAYRYWQAAPADRPNLVWFAQPWFFLSALFLVAIVCLKDLLGTATPLVLKKPFDMAEMIENKISGLVAAGAFVPLVISVFPDAPGTQPGAQWSALGMAAIDPAAVGNALLVPFAILAFLLVWMASHTIHVLILLSPFPVVDTALKTFRILVLSLVAGLSFANPYAGAILCGVIVIVSYFIAGWSYRLTTFGTVCVWDFFTLSHRRFQPAPDANWMFTARNMQGVPVRTYGRLARQGDKLVLLYRPWLLLKQRHLDLPPGTYCVGRGLFYPEITQVGGERPVAALLLPPRYRTHEQAVARLYGLSGVMDVGLRRGFKAALDWVRFALRKTSAPPPATTPTERATAVSTL